MGYGNMIPGVFIPPEDRAFEEPPISTGEAFRTSVANAFINNPLPTVLRFAERNVDNYLFGGKPISKEDFENDEDVKKANSLGGVGIHWEEGMSNLYAKYLAQDYQTRNYYGNIAGKGRGFIQGTVDFAGSIVGGLPDPVNLIGLPEAMVGELALKIGAGAILREGATEVEKRLAITIAMKEARNIPFLESVARGGAGAALGTAIAQPIYALNAPNEYEASTAAQNMLFGIGMGSAMGAGGYAVRQLTLGRQISSLKRVMAAIASDHPIDESFFYRDRAERPPAPMGILSNDLSKIENDYPSLGQMLKTNLRGILEDHRASVDEHLALESSKAKDSISKQFSFLSDLRDELKMEILKRGEDDAAWHASEAERIPQDYAKEIIPAIEEGRIARSKMDEARMHEGETYTPGTDWKATLKEWTGRYEEAQAKIKEIESEFLKQAEEAKSLRAYPKEEVSKFFDKGNVPENPTYSDLTNRLGGLDKIIDKTKDTLPKQMKDSYAKYANMPEDIRSIMENGKIFSSSELESAVRAVLENRESTLNPETAQAIKEAAFNRFYDTTPEEVMRLANELNPNPITSPEQNKIPINKNDDKYIQMARRRGAEEDSGATKTSKEKMDARASSLTEHMSKIEERISDMTDEEKKQFQDTLSKEDLAIEKAKAEEAVMKKLTDCMTKG